MKFLNNISDSGMINEVTDKRFVSSSEKTAITHSNRTIIDNLGDSDGTLTYNGSAVGSGSSVENLTLTTLTLGNYKVSHNIINDALDFEYIGG